MTAVAEQPTKSMADLLGAERWIYATDPFPHIIAYDVFRPDVYHRLVAEFQDVLESTGGRPYMQAHGIHGRTISHDLADRFAPLVSRSWHDLLAAALGIETTGHVAVGLHHHKVGSKDGFPHNDLNPGWFVGRPPVDQLIVAGTEIEYTTGTLCADTGRPVVETVRAASMIFYLANSPCRPGDGGSTGLYRSANDDIQRPAVSVPPLNNSMLLFECTPRSFHGFISNARAPRNSIVMWLHQTKEQVGQIWGEKAIVPYGRSPHRKGAR